MPALESAASGTPQRRWIISLSVVLWAAGALPARGEGYWRFVNLVPEQLEQSEPWPWLSRGVPGKLYYTTTHARKGEPPAHFETLHTWTTPPARLSPGEVVQMEVSLTVLSNGLSEYYVLHKTNAALKPAAYGHATGGAELVDVMVTSKAAPAGRVLKSSTADAKDPVKMPAYSPRRYPDGKIKIVVQAGARVYFNYMYEWVEAEQRAASFDWSEIRLKAELPCQATSGSAVDKCTIRFDSPAGGVITWTNLNSVHRVSIAEQDGGLRIEETSAIQKGRAKLGCVYVMKAAGTALTGNFTGCGSGGFSVQLKQVEEQQRAASFGWSGIPLKAELPCQATSGRAVDKCTIRFDSPAGGVITWTNLNSVHRVSVAEQDGGLRIEETTAIQKGRAKLGCVYAMKASGTGLTGSFTGCGSGGFSVQLK
jgi:hypothetical protein